MKTSFEALNVTEPIIKAITGMGFEHPTEVQSKAIPQILNREDLIVMSKTGSGKTGAFGIPIIQSIDMASPGPQCLILAPTRELAVQVDSDLRAMSKYIKVSTTVVYGQHSINTEIQALEKGAMIVSGTPGRVFDHIKQGTLVTKHIKFLVLDEADRMLDMGFIDQVVRIIKALPKNRVTLLFSATMPDEIQRICREYMKAPVTIEIDSDTKTVDAIHQIYYRVEPDDKRTQLDRLLTIEQPESCMVFCNTRIGVDKVNAFLCRKGYASQALHGANTQSSRMKTIQQFKKGDFQILVATDVAARGIHIDDLSLVINYDLPVEKDSYVHRIGRTGRAGNGGRAITLVTKNEIMGLYEVEEHVGTLIEEETLPTDEQVKAAEAQANNKWSENKAERIMAYREHGDRAKRDKAPGDRPRNEHKPRTAKPRTQSAKVDDRPIERITSAEALGMKPRSSHEHRKHEPRPHKRPYPKSHDSKSPHVAADGVKTITRVETVPQTVSVSSSNASPKPEKVSLFKKIKAAFGIK